MKTRILLVEPHTLIRESLHAVLDADLRLSVIGEADDGAGALREIARSHPDAIVIHMSILWSDTLDTIDHILDSHSTARIVVVAETKDHDMIRHTIYSGALGFLSRDASSTDLSAAIICVAQGRHYLPPETPTELVDRLVRMKDNQSEPMNRDLTDRERDVLRLVSSGATSRRIASRLNISLKTAESHRSRIMRKLGIHSIAELTKYALRHRLTSLETDDTLVLSKRRDRFSR